VEQEPKKHACSGLIEGDAGVIELVDLISKAQILVKPDAEPAETESGE